MKKVLMMAALIAACGTASAEQGYAGALIGMSHIDGGGCPAGVSCDESDVAVKIYGGYKLTDTFALEAAYTNFGEAKASALGVSAGVKVDAFSMGGAVRIPLATAWTGVARLGLAFLQGDGTGLNSGTNDRATKAYMGLGLECDTRSAVKIVSALDVTDGGNIYLLGIGAQVGF